MRDLFWYTDFTLWWHKREWNVPHVRGRWHRNKETSFQYTTAFANMSLSISNRFYLFVNLCYVYSGILQLLYICIWISLVLVNPVKQLVGYRRNIWRHWTSALYQGEHLLFDSNTHHQGEIHLLTGVFRYSRLMMFNWCLFTFIGH